MTKALRAKLDQERLPADGRDLARSHDRVLVVRGVDLLDVAVALATDDTASVALWLTDGRLIRPEKEDLATGAFEVVIVQPFVVARELPPAATA